MEQDKQTEAQHQRRQNEGHINERIDQPAARKAESRQQITQRHANPEARTVLIVQVMSVSRIENWM